MKHKILLLIPLSVFITYLIFAAVTFGVNGQNFAIGVVLWLSSSGMVFLIDQHMFNQKTDTKYVIPNEQENTYEKYMNRRKKRSEIAEMYIQYVRDVFKLPKPKFNVGDTVIFNKFANKSGSWYGSAGAYNHLFNRPLNYEVLSVSVDLEELREKVIESLENEEICDTTTRPWKRFKFDIDKSTADSILELIKLSYDTHVKKEIKKGEFTKYIHITYQLTETLELPEYMLVLERSPEHELLDNMISIDETIRDLNGKRKDIQRRIFELENEKNRLTDGF